MLTTLKLGKTYKVKSLDKLLETFLKVFPKYEILPERNEVYAFYERLERIENKIIIVKEPYSLYGIQTSYSFNTPMYIVDINNKEELVFSHEIDDSYQKQNLIF